MKKTVLVLTCVLFSVFVGFAQNNGYMVGNYVSDFSLKNSNDKVVSLSSFVNAKGYVIVFTDNLSANSPTSEKVMSNLNNKSTVLGFPLIIITPGSNQPVIENEYHTFPILTDANNTVCNQFGITYLPQIYVIQKEDTGNILRYKSAVNLNSPNDVENVINNLLTESDQTKYPW